MRPYILTGITGNVQQSPSVQSNSLGQEVKENIELKSPGAFWEQYVMTRDDIRRQHWILHPNLCKSCQGIYNGNILSGPQVVQELKGNLLPCPILEELD